MALISTTLSLTAYNAVTVLSRDYVCLLNAWIVSDKRKKVVPTLLHHVKDHSSSFITRRMVGGGE